MWKKAEGRTTLDALKRFAKPFLTVMAYYVIGIATFSVMAAPDAKDFGFFTCYAIDHTALFALAAAVVAGVW
jgi:hypothetical protein